MLYYSKKLEENGKHSEAEEKLKMVLHNLEFMARGASMIMSEAVSTDTVWMNAGMVYLLPLP